MSLFVVHATSFDCSTPRIFHLTFEMTLKTPTQDRGCARQTNMIQIGRKILTSTEQTWQ